MNLIFLPLILATAAALRAEINNIHNGFKIVIEGEATPEGNALLLRNIAVVEDTLTETVSLGGLLSIGERGATVELAELAPVLEMENFLTPFVALSWEKNTQITVGFSFPDENPGQEDQEGLYQHIRAHVLPLMEDL